MTNTHIREEERGPGVSFSLGLDGYERTDICFTIFEFKTDRRKRSYTVVVCTVREFESELGSSGEKREKLLAS